MNDKPYIVQLEQYYNRFFGGRVTVTALGVKYVEFKRENGIISICTIEDFEFAFKQISN